MKILGAASLGSNFTGSYIKKDCIQVLVLVALVVLDQVLY